MWQSRQYRSLTDLKQATEDLRKFDEVLRKRSAACNGLPLAQLREAHKKIWDEVSDERTLLENAQKQARWKLEEAKQRCDSLRHNEEMIEIMRVDLRERWLRPLVLMKPPYLPRQKRRRSWHPRTRIDRTEEAAEGQREVVLVTPKFTKKSN
jgi:predicted nuclease with TOPRIM domain